MRYLAVGAWFEQYFGVAFVFCYSYLACFLFLANLRYYCSIILCWMVNLVEIYREKFNV